LNLDLAKHRLGNKHLTDGCERLSIGLQLLLIWIIKLAVFVAHGSYSLNKAARQSDDTK
jgi:hypothetical protein